MNKNIHTFGYWTALTAFLASVAYDLVQSLQVFGVLKFPADSISIYFFSLLIPIPFLLAMLALHYSVKEDKKIWTHAALLLSVIYATYVTLNYVVQLGTVLPATFMGNYEQIKLLDQTPHSLFWDIDALGYIMMGLAMLLALPALEKKGISLWLRRFFLANALMDPVISIVYFYPVFSYSLLILGAPWMFTASGAILFLALYFRSQIKTTG